ncbi:MAG: sulfotransferase family protein [Steroidobacteraceae bacterium]
MALKVIGAGLGRTGTVSLKLALEKLGVGRCYHMIEVFAHPEHVPLWVRAVQGEPDWDTLLAGYGATADYPACLFWRQLADRYPEAKVILTVRDPNEWFESTQATIFSPQNPEPPSDSPTAAMVSMLHGEYEDLHDRTSMIAAFERHNQAVIDGLPRDRVLIYQAEQGWDSLCRFLGIPVPEEPFPRANTRADFQAMQAAMRGPDGTLDAERRRQVIADRLNVLRPAR